MDKRRRLGLCFNCDEKFARGHNRVYKHLFFLELHDDESDDDNTEEPATDNRVISLHAIVGVTTSKTTSSAGTTTEGRGQPGEAPRAQGAGGTAAPRPLLQL